MSFLSIWTYWALELLGIWLGLGLAGVFWTKGFGTGLDILDNLGNVALRLQTETYRILKH